ncbi:MAG: hypothetical protein Q9164_007434 [Protoblastenia rupestris]
MSAYPVPPHSTKATISATSPDLNNDSSTSTTIPTASQTAERTIVEHGLFIEQEIGEPNDELEDDMASQSGEEDATKVEIDTVTDDRSAITFLDNVPALPASAPHNHPHLIDTTNLTTLPLGCVSFPDLVLTVIYKADQLSSFLYPELKEFFDLKIQAPGRSESAFTVSRYGKKIYVRRPITALPARTLILFDIGIFRH